jgi:hypothetical protein
MPVDLWSTIPPPALRESLVNVELRLATNRGGDLGYAGPGTRICTVESPDGESAVTYMAGPYAGSVADYHAEHRQSTVTTLATSLEDADFLEDDATAYATSQGVLYSVHLDGDGPSWDLPITELTTQLLEEWIAAWPR